jgi:hypothetical protein
MYFLSALCATPGDLLMQGDGSVHIANCYLSGWTNDYPNVLLFVDLKQRSQA